MPSPMRTEARLCVVALTALLLAAPSVGADAVQEAPVAARGEGPGPAEIARAIEIIRADPNLAPERTIKTLRWKNAAEKKPYGTPAWLAWIAGLFRWLEQSARLLVWGAAIMLAGLLVVYIVRLVRTYGVPQREDQFVAPTHVRDLDIRPETLPRDIGAAARALWDRGERRASLALLYRGLLSRLAHVHRIAIRDSSTEGDCLELAARHLTTPPREYTSRLVCVWQRSVYGREDVEAATVYALCDEFAAALDVSQRPSIAAGGAA